MKTATFPEFSAFNLLRPIAYTVAAIVAITIPLVYFTNGYQFESGTVKAEGLINSYLVTQRINENPEMWHFEENRLLDLVERSPIFGEQRERRSIVDVNDKVIVQNTLQVPLSPPFITTRSPLRDSGRVVGYYVIQRSISSLLDNTIMVALAAGLLSLITVIALNLLPLRALQRAQNELLYRANHDLLTGLPNRGSFRSALLKAMSRANRQHCMLAVLFVDLDRFKLLNDSLGHDAGDEILCTVSSRLTQVVRAGDTVARLGGDEFAIVIESITQVAHIASVAETVRRSFEESFIVADKLYHLTCSIGISVFPSDARSPDDLIKFADLAMHLGKQSGRNNYMFYTADMNASVEKRLRLENDLRQAYENKEFILHYQPVYDLSSRQIVGMEALVRWNSPQRGLVPPLEFISVLEDTGLIVPVGEWIIQEACRQTKKWMDSGLPPLVISINVSPRQFNQAGKISLTIDQALKDSGLPPHLLKIEVTEGLLMEDSELSVTKLQELKNLGVEIAVDDFGTGYSSLAYLKRFPMDTLKIDRSFVRDLSAESDDANIVIAIIQLAHSLNLTVTAEGIETEQQLYLLHSYGCDTAQGYLLGRPQPAELFETYVAEHGVFPEKLSIAA